MERYLEILVIPALIIAMGGLLLILFMWKKGSPVSRSSAATQSDEEPVHVCVINHEIQDKIVDVAMAKVKTFLSEEFQRKQEEFYKTRRQAEMEFERGIAPLIDSSFVSLWVKELQTSDEKPSLELEANQEMIDVKPCKIKDMSSNLCRSIMAYAMDYKSGSCSNEEMICDSLPTTSHVAAPQLLKGGADASSGRKKPFVWRLDIDDNVGDPSPPNTPVRHLKPPKHLCRGVHFDVAEHPRAMNIIQLDPAQGYGWRGPDWKATFGKHHIFQGEEHEGPSAYRKRKKNLTSEQSKANYYKSLEADARRKWKGVKERYRRAKEVALLKAAIHEDIHRSAEWRKQLQEKAELARYQSSSSSPDTEEREVEERSGKVTSMLATSSSSNDSDDSMLARFKDAPKRKGKRRQCCKT